jgi:tetratricopeptide (TPR) repeat protein
LADALITRLSKLRRFSVRPTSSVMRYGDGDADPFAAGHELGVSFVVDGRIQRAGDRIRITIQLLNVYDGATVWAEQFDEKYTDVLSLEDAISAQVAQALVPQLTGDEREKLAKRGTDNAEAFEAYLRGRYHWNTFHEDGFAKAITCYYRAIALDPDYAAAYTGIADYYNWIGIFGVCRPPSASPPRRSRAQASDGRDNCPTRTAASASPSTRTTRLETPPSTIAARPRTQPASLAWRNSGTGRNS